jgi:phage-related baseplate assembly protein
LAENSRLYAATRTSTWGVRHLTSDSKQLSAEMTATLSAELDGRVPQELIDEVVRAVLDESRRAAQDRGAEFTMLEARQRLERFIRARSSAYTTLPIDGR